MAMQSTFTARRGANVQPEINGTFGSNQPSFCDSPMAETLVGVEPWMQEMLNEGLFPTNDLDFTYESLMGPESGLDPTALTVNDTSKFDLFPQGDAQLFDDASLSFDNDFDAQLASFLSGNLDTNTASNEMTQDTTSQFAIDQVETAFRDLVRARAAADPRAVSRQEKQRDTSIALRLAKLRDACDDAVALLSSPNACNTSASNSVMNSPDLNTFLCDQSWGQSSVSERTPSVIFDNFVITDGASQQSSPKEPCVSTPNSETPLRQWQPAQQAVTGGVEMVMDLNMNTATTLPRRHRPRTQAQRERYLAVRNRGACEKHKKQHKRCTCIEKELESASITTHIQDKNAKVTKHISSLPASSGRYKSSSTSSTDCTASPMSSDLGFSPLNESRNALGHYELSAQDEEDLRWQYLRASVENADTAMGPRGNAPQLCQNSEKTLYHGLTTASPHSSSASEQAYESSDGGKFCSAHSPRVNDPLETSTLRVRKRPMSSPGPEAAMHNFALRTKHGGDLPSLVLPGTTSTAGEPPQSYRSVIGSGHHCHRLSSGSQDISDNGNHSFMKACPDLSSFIEHTITSAGAKAQSANGTKYLAGPSNTTAATAARTIAPQNEIVSGASRTSASIDPTTRLGCQRAAKKGILPQSQWLGGSKSTSYDATSRGTCDTARAVSGGKRGLDAYDYRLGNAGLSGLDQGIAVRVITHSNSRAIASQPLRWSFRLIASTLLGLVVWLANTPSALTDVWSVGRIGIIVSLAYHLFGSLMSHSNWRNTPLKLDTITRAVSKFFTQKFRNLAFVDVVLPPSTPSRPKHSRANCWKTGAGSVLESYRTWVIVWGVALTLGYCSGIPKSRPDAYL